MTAVGLRIFSAVDEKRSLGTNQATWQDWLVFRLKPKWRTFAVALPVVGLFATGAALGFSTTDEKPCVATKFDFPEVDAACASGGQKAASKLMKDAVKRAKAAGESMTCKSCHTDTKSWELTANAVADYKKWRE